jgi:hypothetical protein
MVKVAGEPRYRRCITVDETKLYVKGVHVYVWSAVDVVEVVRGNALAHMDMSDAQSWDEIVNAAREVVEECYRDARTDQGFGVAVFIDEVHNFVPQSPSEGAASRQAYEDIIPVMKLVATTGPQKRGATVHRHPEAERGRQVHNHPDGPEHIRLQGRGRGPGEAEGDSGERHSICREDITQRVLHIQGARAEGPEALDSRRGEGRRRGKRRKGPANKVDAWIDAMLI